MQTICVECVVFSASAIVRAATDEISDNDVKAISAAISTFVSGGSRCVVLIDSSTHRLGESIASQLPPEAIDSFVVCRPDDEHWSVAHVKEGRRAQRVSTLSDAVDFARGASKTIRERTISVAGDGPGLALRQFSRLHFHVGDTHVLMRKYRDVIPLIGQREFGLINTLLHFGRNSARHEASLDHGDIIRFAESACSFYASPEAPRVMLAKARRAANALVQQFPNIVGIFGGGYPFYLTEHADAPLDPTPPSILHYVNVQRHYLAQKAVAEKVYRTEGGQSFSKNELFRRMRLTVSRNDFDAYEFAKLGVVPPPVAPDGLTLEEYIMTNCLDVLEDLWPCHYCSVLQNADRYPEQGVAKEFSYSCLSCRQTTMLPRNVTGCSADVDLIVIVEGGVAEAANAMKAFLADHDEFHIYDTDFPRMFIDNNGPVDLFVVDAVDFLSALGQLAVGDWTRVMLPSLAVWLPVTPHELELGNNFALCFEPLWLVSHQWRERLATARRLYASRLTADEVIGRLSAGSFYHRQIMANSQIREMITKKLMAWCSSSVVADQPAEKTTS